MNNLPLVSVIIPVYNDEEYIKECIESICSQNYSNIEIIIIDDGSTDNTASILKSLDSPFIYHHQQNKGSAVARNKGIELSRGEYITFNDADDIWAPNRLFHQVTFMEENKIYQASCGVDVAVNKDFELTQATPVKGSSSPELIVESTGWQYLTLLQSMPYHIINLMLTRKLALTLSFDPRLRRGQDYDYWIQISQKTQIAHINETYGYYRQNPNSNTRKPHLINYKLLLINKAIENYGISDQNQRYLSKKQIREIYYQIHFCHGFELYRKRCSKYAFIPFIKALTYIPYKKGPYKFLLFNFFRWLFN